MGEAGLALVEKKLPNIIKDYHLNFVIAQAENVTEGKGCSPEDFRRLKQAGVNFCTGGNWSIYQKSLWPILNDPHQPIIRPANYPDSTPGLGYKYLDIGFGSVLVVSLLGKIVGKDSQLKLENPLQVVDAILKQEESVPKVAIVVNFHGDYSSEKVVIGHYLNGRVNAVIGDHWHVPTADGRLLDKGTAHLTDVGMVGSLNSSLGIKLDNIINRWRDGIVNRNELDLDGPFQLNGFIFEVDLSTKKTVLAQSINLVFDE